MMNLKDKVVIITGSSSGIGEGTAYKFAKAKSKVVLNCKSNEKGARKVLKNIKAKKGEAIFIKGDVSKQTTVNNIYKETLNKFGQIDILINNAGSAVEPDFFKAKRKDWIESFDNNLFGTMLLSQKIGKYMKRQGNGKILNTASIRGLEHCGREGIMAYSVAKAGVINFTKTLAKLLAPDVQVNAVAPGFTWTPNYEAFPEELNQSFIDGTLLKKWVQVKDIADAFIYLAKADLITGEVLTVDAGWSLKQG